jgi:hypothetical protein
VLAFLIFGDRGGSTPKYASPIAANPPAQIFMRIPAGSIFKLRKLLRYEKSSTHAHTLS